MEVVKEIIFKKLHRHIRILRTFNPQNYARCYKETEPENCRSAKSCRIGIQRVYRKRNCQIVWSAGLQKLSKVQGGPFISHDFKTLITFFKQN